MTSILLCVTAGRGPVECRMAAFMVAKEIGREAAESGLAVASTALVGGDNLAASVMISVEGDKAVAFAASWSGTVRWTAKSSVRLGHERKNWFVGVHALPPPDAAFVLDAKDVRFEAMRAGGPGGQHQNKTESAIRAVHVPTGLTAEARDERSQHRNKARALERLREILAAREDARLNAGRYREWLSRIAVTRGDPIRIYEGSDFKRKA